MILNRDAKPGGREHVCTEKQDCSTKQLDDPGDDPSLQVTDQKVRGVMQLHGDASNKRYYDVLVTTVPVKQRVLDGSVHVPMLGR